MLWEWTFERVTVLFSLTWHISKSRNLPCFRLNYGFWFPADLKMLCWTKENKNSYGVWRIVLYVERVSQGIVLLSSGVFWQWPLGFVLWCLLINVGNKICLSFCSEMVHLPCIIHVHKSESTEKYKSILFFHPLPKTWLSGDWFLFSKMAG